MKNVPNLRFKEFSDEWKQHALGDIFDFYTTNSFSRDFLDNDKGRVKNIHYGDIHMKFPTLLDVKNTQIPYVKEAVDLSKISIESYCKNGDVVIADASEDYNDIGKAIELKSIGEEKIIAGLHTILARDNKGIMVNGFKGYLMNSPSVRKQIKVYAAGAKVLGISKANISKVKLLIPSGMEQEKIATFFSLIDKKIELQTEKVEELKNYKKGFMQKIFSRELRFKGFSGEWESKKIGSICEIIMGQSPSSACYNEDKIGLPLIQGNADIKNRKTFPRVYTSDITKTCDVGDIIMSVRAPVGAISRSLHHACIGRGVCSIKPKQNSEFIYQFLLNYENKWSRISQGSTFESINSFDITSTNIVLPLKEEQEKIASFFSLIDKKLELEMEKLEQLQEYKKGLLQQMFI